jgi:dihydroneopterin aldolase
LTGRPRTHYHSLMSDQDCISLKGMRFHTLVGLLPHEQSVPQPLELDLTVWRSLRQVGESDSPSALLDYRDLYAMVETTVGTSHIRLLEALCERLAAQALELNGVHRARVAARKPHAPIEGPLDYVEVVVDRIKGRDA